MNLVSAIVLLTVLALAVLAVWRNVRKGAPCECGGSCKSCRGGGSCCCCEES